MSTMLKPVVASQPGEDGDQDANSDEEAERNHPYPHSVPFALFLQPRLRMSKLWSRQMGMDMVFLGFGLRDGGGWVDARVEGVPADGDGWVECFGVETLEVNWIIGPGHGIRHVKSSQPRRYRSWLRVQRPSREDSLLHARRGFRLIRPWQSDEVISVLITSRAGRRAAIPREIVFARTNLNDNG